jgi:hypothetical protein
MFSVSATDSMHSTDGRPASIREACSSDLQRLVRQAHWYLMGHDFCTGPAIFAICGIRALWAFMGLPLAVPLVGSLLHRSHERLIHAVLLWVFISKPAPLTQRDESPTERLLGRWRYCLHGLDSGSMIWSNALISRRGGAVLSHTPSLYCK